ncbi:hypothetical protein [Streptomyces sp. Ru87]|uniref:hypothetical protein n=1 Tax=Streptomyces sp. Ru87 TaxID=2044307 RepID=UPI0015D49829|nr:hypothetical protein [Streptomyces sp. Ru87]
MSRTVPPAWATVRPAERLADAPVVRRDGHWWLVSPAGSLPVPDPGFAAELGRFADGLAAADQAVGQLNAAYGPNP